LRTFKPQIVKPLPALALEPPLEPIAGKQPSEFVFAVQYATGLEQVRSMRKTVMLAYGKSPT
jgi:hypothetical protein